MIWKPKNVGEGSKNSRSFRMWLNINDYQFKQVDIVIGQHIYNQKSETNNRYQKLKRKEHKYTTKENH